MPVALKLLTDAERCLLRRGLRTGVNGVRTHCSPSGPPSQPFLRRLGAAPACQPPGERDGDTRTAGRPTQRPPRPLLNASAIVGDEGPSKTALSVLQPPLIHCGEPGCPEHFRALLQEALRHRMQGFSAPRLEAVLEMPLQLANCRGVERRLELLMDDRLIGVVGMIERPRKHDPTSRLGVIRSSAAWV